MTPLSALRRQGPSALKHSISFGGGDGTFNQQNFWLSDDLRNRFHVSSSVGHREEIAESFEGYVQAAYKANGVVFACILARLLPFSEALFRFQELNDGEPGELHYGPGLSILENPWPNGTTGELLARMEQDASLAGNFYATPVNGRLRRMRPDWVTIISGVPGDEEASPFSLDAEVLGYIYHPKPPNRLKRPDPVLLTPSQVVHYSPIPDPEAQWRGMSWLTPVLNEIKSDTAATKHKLKFFENGATSNFVVTYDENLAPEAFERYVKMFEAAHTGVDKAYKTIHLGGGADAKVIGADLKQLDFRATQGAGETRIAAAAGVGAIIGRFSEGMQGSSLNQGNYNSAKRQFADMTLRPLWRMAAAALEKIAPPPGGQRLWYADRHIEFLKEDAKAAAEVFSIRANATRTLTDGGFTADSVVRAVNDNDLRHLTHSGLHSVQLQRPGTAALPPASEDTSEA